MDPRHTGTPEEGSSELLYNLIAQQQHTRRFLMNSHPHDIHNISPRLGLCRARLPKKPRCHVTGQQASIGPLLASPRPARRYFYPRRTNHSAAAAGRGISLDNVRCEMMWRWWRLGAVTTICLLISADTGLFNIRCQLCSCAPQREDYNTNLD